MKVVLLCHSLLSDWNHGNAHFLRGIVSELHARGHDIVVYEPADAWSTVNLEAEIGALPVAELLSIYPGLRVVRYDKKAFDVEAVVDGAHVVLVHEWTDSAVVEAIGRHRIRSGSYRLFFHDTHHRIVAGGSDSLQLDLDGYDGVLAFGEALRDWYSRSGWASRAFTWHEAADVRVFRPMPSQRLKRDMVWIGNWGDGERTEELHEFMIRPVEKLGLSACAFGVRYPETARRALAGAGIAYGGFLPNYRVPLEFSCSRFTLHVPRRPYVEALPGVPTIRVFEALACGIPLVSAPWSDTEGLFEPGDYVQTRSGEDVIQAAKKLLSDDAFAHETALSGRSTILARHTCSHRVDELFAICVRIGLSPLAFTPVVSREEQAIA